MLMIFIAELCRGQGLSFSTLGQVFNYAVGDSFEYSYDNYGMYNIYGSTGNFTCGGYSLMVISSISYNGDTLVYHYRYLWDNTANSTVACTSPFDYGGAPQYPFPAYSYADSTYNLSSPDSLTSSLYGFCSGGALCADSAFRNGNYNNHEQNSYNEFDGGFYQTLGDSIGVINEGYFEEDNKSGEDLRLIWYHKVDGDQWGTPVNIIPTGVKYLHANSIAVQLFPNPSNGQVSIQLSIPPSEITSFNLFELNGRPVYNQDVTNQTTELRMPGLSNGLYIWQLSIGNAVVARGKLLLE